MSTFKVYWTGIYPSKQKIFHDGEFAKRYQARMYCRNNSWKAGLTIVHPDGKEESYHSTRHMYD